MDEDKQREIAKKGGESVPDERRSFSHNSELASEAGRKGGQVAMYLWALVSLLPWWSVVPSHCIVAPTKFRGGRDHLAELPLWGRAYKIARIQKWADARDRASRK